MLPVLYALANGNMQGFWERMQSYGLLDAILPFILLFAIIFTIINKTKVLGENKNVHMLVALALSLLVVVPHILGTYPAGTDVIQIINSSIPQVALLIVVIIMALILIGIFRPSDKGIPGAGILAIIAAGVVVYIFGLSAGWWNSFGLFNFLQNPDVQIVIVIVLVFGLVMFMITAESPLNKVKDLFGGMFK
jgi:hypothetical protein